MSYYIPLHISSPSQWGEAERYFFRRQSYPRLPASGALQIAGLGGFGRRLGPSELEQLRYSRRLQWSAGAIKLVFSVMTELHYIQMRSNFCGTAKQCTIPRAFAPESSKSRRMQLR